MVGHPDAIGTSRHQSRRIARVQDALDQQPAFPPVADLAEIVPVETCMEAAANTRGDRQAGAVVTEIAADVLELGQTAAQQAQRPARMKHAFPEMPGRRPQWDRYAVPKILFALATGLQINGHHQRRIAKFFRSPHQLAIEVEILEHIKLEPQRPLYGSRHAFDAGRGHGGERVGDAASGCRPRDGNVGSGPDQRAGAHRADHQRCWQGLGPERRGNVRMRNIGKHARQNSDLFEIASIGFEGEFLPRPAIDEFEDGFRQTTTGKRAKVLDRNLAIESAHLRSGPCAGRR